jgi:hypothetical protein
VALAGCAKVFYEIGDLDDVVHDLLPIFAIEVDVLCAAHDSVSDRIGKRRSRTTLITVNSRRTPAITPKNGTFLTRDDVSFNKLVDVSVAPLFASTSASVSGDWRISRGTGGSRSSTVA